MYAKRLFQPALRSIQLISPDQRCLRTIRCFHSPTGRQQQSPQELWDELFHQPRSREKRGLDTSSTSQSSADTSANEPATDANEPADNPSPQQQLVKEIERYVERSRIERDDWSDVDRRSWHKPSTVYEGSKHLIFDVGDKIPALTRDDFTRIAPRRRHLPSWRNGGGIVNVYPICFPNTLDYKGSYLLEFTTPEAAARYLDYAHAQHKIIHGMTSDAWILLESTKTASLNDVRKNFALTSGSRELALRMLRNEDDARHFLLKPSRYSATKDTRVKVQLDCGGLDEEREIKHLLRVYYTELNWSGALQEMGSRIGKVAKVRRLETARKSYYRGTLPLCAWEVSFNSETDARRFVRHWHRRTLVSATMLGNTGTSKSRLMCLAQHLW